MSQHAQEKPDSPPADVPERLSPDDERYQAGEYLRLLAMFIMGICVGICFVLIYIEVWRG